MKYQICSVWTAALLLSVSSSTVLAITPIALTDPSPSGAYNATSAVVLDFSNDGGGVHAFEIRYHNNGAVTGLDMLDVIAGKFVDFEITSTPSVGLFNSFGIDYPLYEAKTGGNGYQAVDFGWGLLVTEISYGGATGATPETWADGFSYWHENPAGTDWIDAQIGAGTRFVSDGSWDGWVFHAPAPVYPDVGASPAFTPIPEPGTGSLLLLGLCWRAGRRRRTGIPGQSSRLKP